MQRVVPDIAESFAPIEKALAEEFIPALFGGSDAPSREISQLPVRFAGVGVSNPVSAADANFALSLSMTADVSASLKSGSELDAIGYGLDSARVLRQAKKAREAELADKLERLKASARPPDARRMVRSTTTGA